MALHKVRTSQSFFFMDEVTVDPDSVAANTAVDQTFTVKGLAVDMQVVVAMPDLEAGLVITNAHVSAKDTLKVRLLNTTGAPVDPASQIMKVVAL